MKIGELSRIAGCSVETIRYYEQAGLLPAPPRSDGNYRQYNEAGAERLAFIRRCRSLDMSLDEIRALLAAADADGDCRTADAVIDAHLSHIEARILDLRNLQTQLRELRDACRQPGPVSDCGTLRGLATEKLPAAPPPSKKRRVCGK